METIASVSWCRRPAMSRSFFRRGHASARAEIEAVEVEGVARAVDAATNALVTQVRRRGVCLSAAGARRGDSEVANAFDGRLAAGNEGGLSTKRSNCSTLEHGGIVAAASKLVNRVFRSRQIPSGREAHEGRRGSSTHRHCLRHRFRHGMQRVGDRAGTGFVLWRSGRRVEPRRIAPCLSGSQVRVVNLDNGRSVTLKIVDRGPFIRGRIIDVSPAAAETLGFRDAGLAHVKIDLVRSKQRSAAPGATGGLSGPGHLIHRDLPLWRRQREIPAKQRRPAVRRCVGVSGSPFAALPLCAEVGGPRTLRGAGEAPISTETEAAARIPVGAIAQVPERAASASELEAAASIPVQRFSPRFRRSSSPRRRRTRSFPFSPVSVISSISSVSTFDDGGPGRLLPQTPRHLAAAKARSMVLGRHHSSDRRGSCYWIRRLWISSRQGRAPMSPA